MAPIKFSFSNLQLLQLLHEHLVLSGLLESAEVLQKEAKLEPLVDIVEQQQPVYPVGSMISFTPSDFSHRHSRPEQEDEEKREELSLTSLVSSKLTEQFKSCKKCRTDRTLTTAIVRDLLLPHKCPPRSRRQQERNVTKRFFMSQTGTFTILHYQRIESLEPARDSHTRAFLIGFIVDKNVINPQIGSEKAHILAILFKSLICQLDKISLFL